MKFVKKLEIRNSRRISLFRCDYCGVEKEIRHDLGLNRKSCGCSTQTIINKSRKTHGDSGAINRVRLYRIWHNMKQRCNNPSATKYARYGGRGIAVFDGWNDYSAFKEWALTTGYSYDLCIDRKDNNGDYTPENCRWITNMENSQNGTQSKLTPSAVWMLRKLHKQGESIKDLGSLFCVHPVYASRVATKKTWRNI